MDLQISVETTFDDGTKRTHRLERVSRPYRLTQPEAFGLLLEDSKVILRQIQKALISDQVELRSRHSFREAARIIDTFCPARSRLTQRCATAWAKSRRT